jgi:hypothetical protein
MFVQDWEMEDALASSATRLVMRKARAPRAQEVGSELCASPYQPYEIRLLSRLFICPREVESHVRETTVTLK